jgi:hypothetical protein
MTAASLLQRFCRPPGMRHPWLASGIWRQTSGRPTRRGQQDAALITFTEHSPDRARTSSRQRSPVASATWSPKPLGKQITTTPTPSPTRLAPFCVNSHRASSRFLCTLRSPPRTGRCRRARKTSPNTGAFTTKAGTCCVNGVCSGCVNPACWQMRSRNASAIPQSRHGSMRSTKPGHARGNGAT